MRKVKLDLEDVSVESFDVLPDDIDGLGSVKGYNTEMYTCDEACGGGTPVSCEGTCGKTCPNPCDTSPNSCSCLRTCPCDYDGANPYGVEGVPE